jgi:hypothetical protein
MGVLADMTNVDLSYPGTCVGACMRLSACGLGPYGSYYGSIYNYQSYQYGVYSGDYGFGPYNGYFGNYVDYTAMYGYEYSGAPPTLEYMQCVDDCTNFLPGTDRDTIVSCIVNATSCPVALACGM